LRVTLNHAATAAAATTAAAAVTHADGVVHLHSCRYLVMDNLTGGYSQPCVLDIKVRE
jgi:hypothetical protein